MAILLYGANGYTGQLVARRAAALGLSPADLILAGRRAAPLQALSRELGFEARVFSLERPAGLDGSLAGVRAVLSCAGPFSRTAGPLAEACLRSRVHYLDITGEIEVFETLWRRDAEARAAGVMLLPGAGFDVVPTDCLAAHLAARLPSATHLRLAFQAGRTSRGTATTAVENIGRGGRIRRDGALIAVPLGHRTIEVVFGDQRLRALAIPWGDVFTAYVTTGIPNIELYTVLPGWMRAFLRATRTLGPVLATGPAQRMLKAHLARRGPGPSETERRSGRFRIWGEAQDASGRTVVSRLYGPDAYELTATVALELARRAAAGDAPPGYETPARAYGKDLILGFAGVRREDD